jgi:hypothetical protein
VTQGRTDERVRVVSFMTRSGLVSGPNPDEFEALAGRCAVFRVDPVLP